MTPGGTRIEISSWIRTRPSPVHLGHGSSITVPSPWHRSHVVTLMSCPKSERCTARSCPDPFEGEGQADLEVPPAALASPAAPHAALGFELAEPSASAHASEITHERAE